MGSFHSNWMSASSTLTERLCTACASIHNENSFNGKWINKTKRLKIYKYIYDRKIRLVDTGLPFVDDRIDLTIICFDVQCGFFLINVYNMRYTMRYLGLGKTQFTKFFCWVAPGINYDIIPVNEKNLIRSVNCEQAYNTLNQIGPTLDL